VLTPSDPLTGSSPPAVGASLLLQCPETANSSIDNVSDGLDIQPIDVNNSDVEETREDGNANSEGEVTEPDEDDEAELCKSSISVFDLSSLLVV
jgi:hypothetical protein